MCFLHFQESSNIFLNVKIDNTFSKTFLSSINTSLIYKGIYSSIPNHYNDFISHCISLSMNMSTCHHRCASFIVIAINHYFCEKAITDRMHIKEIVCLNFYFALLRCVDTRNDVFVQNSYSLLSLSLYFLQAFQVCLVNQLSWRHLNGMTSGNRNVFNFRSD